MKLFELFGTIAVDNDKANKEIDETTNKAEKSEGRMSGAFKKIGAAVATYFAVDQIATFGKQIVETAASVAAESSAFEQIMGSYSDQAKAKMSEVADATGVVDTRLTGYMTSMTAKFKGLGYDIDEATTLASDGLMLASDAAAFWDKSLDDSMSALNSFINGNYEGGEAIGLFSNDTQMAAYAVKEGIVSTTKEWANLDEATKQATRLEYAQAMYEQSGATGQAAKESGQYANVMANLAENWRQFQAIIGTPILEAVVPILGQLGQGFQYVIDTLQNASSLGEGFSQIFSTLGATITAQLPTLVQQGAEMLSSLGQGIQQNLPTLIDQGLQMLLSFSQVVLENLPTLVSAGMGFIQNIVQGLIASLPSLIEYVPQIINNFANAINTSMPIILAKGAEIIWNIITGLIGAIPTLVANIPQIIMAIVNVFTAFNWLSLGKNLITGIWNGIKSMGSSLVSGVKGILDNMGSTISTIWNTIKSNASNVWNAIKGGISGIVNGIKSVVTSVFNSVKSTVTTIWNGIKSAIQNPIETAKNLVKGAIDSIKGFFNFQFKWPSLPLPHFSINPSGWQIGDLLKGSIPSLGISWYAKGAIFDEPTIFPTVNGLKGVGEAGAEAVAPIDALLGYVQKAVSAEVSQSNKQMLATLDKLLKLLGDYLPDLLTASNKAIVLDSGVLVGETALLMDKRLGNISRKRERGQ